MYTCEQSLLVVRCLDAETQALRRILRDTRPPEGAWFAVPRVQAHISPASPQQKPLQLHSHGMVTNGTCGKVGDADARVKLHLVAC